MSYIKIFTLGLIAFAFSACSEDEVLNTGDATIEFETTDVSIKESVTSLNIPIVVTGEHNGKIVLNATMTAKSEGIEIDKNVIITSETLNINEDTERVNLEVRLSGISNEDIINGRTITFEIMNAEGAKIGANKTCTVALIENNPIEGMYITSGEDPFGAGFINCSLTMVDGSDDTAYLDFGMGGKVLVEFTDIKGAFSKCKFKIASGQIIGNDANYGDIYLGYGYVDFDAQTVKYDPSKQLIGTYENGIFTFDVPMYGGFGLYCSAGTFYFYAEGRDIPCALIKQ